MNKLESYLRIARSWSTAKRFIFALKLINLDYVTIKETQRRLEGLVKKVLPDV